MHDFNEQRTSSGDPPRAQFAMSLMEMTPNPHEGYQKEEEI